ncbi:MAG: hypothetical protein GY710_24895 [Desulfobacteraceae bacterium]|nr:hypothetical protein [Desulfobacteraceae bacterium]
MKKISKLIKKRFQKWFYATKELSDRVSELSDRASELKAEKASLQEVLEIAQRETLTQGERIREAKNKAYRAKEFSRRKNKIDSQAIDDKLEMQGTLFRARKVAKAPAPLLLNVNDALAGLPAPQTDGGKGTQSNLITNGMIEEKAWQTRQEVVVSEEATILRKMLEDKNFSNVSITDITGKKLFINFSTDVANASFSFHGEFSKQESPLEIFNKIKIELEGANVEYRQSLVSEGTGEEYEYREGVSVT